MVKLEDFLYFYLKRDLESDTGIVYLYKYTKYVYKTSLISIYY